MCRLQGSKLVSCKWIFKQKDSIPGTDQPRFKARLVVRDVTQREELNTMIFSLLL